MDHADGVRLAEGWVADPHFDPLGVTVGHDALAVRCVNERGGESTELL
jgi:hypothetical protein